MKKNIQDLVLESFEKFRDRTAIEQGTKKLTYRNIKDRVFKVCSYLVSECEEEYIAVLCDNKINSICAMIGILLAGKVFILIEKRYPDKRKQQMLNAINCSLIITDILCPLEEDKGYQYVSINELQAINNNIVLPNYSEQNPVYIFFTSGTTGDPKAVIGQGKGLLHFILWEIDTFQIRMESCFAQLTSVSHDPFLRDIFVPLISGGRICIPEDEFVIYESKYIVEFINQYKITHIHCTPSMFKVINAYTYTCDDFRELKYIFFAGEELRIHIFKKFYQIFKNRITFVNFYGLTEMTMAQMYHVVTTNDMIKELIPLGKPITNTIVRIMKNELEECEDGEIGEIYISSEYGTLGYTGLEYTNSRFVTMNKEIYYKTGDMGYKTSNGQNFFCGRKDNQIKIRGNRIEISEIENALIEFTDITDAIVLPRLNSKNKDYYLCSYFISDKELEILDIKNSLSRLLPDFMIPQRFYRVSNFPINENGKIDIEKLNNNVLISTVPDCKESYDINPTELALKVALDKVLAEEQMNYTVDNDLFLCGLDSLKVFEVINYLEEQFCLTVKASDIFLLRSIRKISNKVKPLISSVDKKKEHQKCNEDNCTVLPIQEKIYETEVKFKHFNFFNWSMIRIYRLKKEVEIDDLQDYVNTIISRHEILRSYFEIDNRKLIRKVQNQVQLKLRYHNFTGARTELILYIRSIASNFSLNTCPLVDAFVINNGTSKYFCLNIHHIIADEKTFSIFINEISMLCNKIKLSESVKQYYEFVELRNCQRNKDLSYWLAKNKDVKKIKLLNFMMTRSFESCSYKSSLEVQHLNNNMGLTRYMICAASTILLLYMESGEHEISILSFHDLRVTSNFNEAMGLFTHNAILLTKISDNFSIKHFLNLIKDSILNSFEYDNYYYENLTDSFKRGGNYEHNILLNYRKDVVTNLVDTIFEPMSYEEDVCNMDMIFEIVEGKDDIKVLLKCKKGMYPDEYMSYVNRLYNKILKSLARDTTMNLHDYILRLKKQL